jgi:AcrR family transcriptional regulator
LIETSIWSVVLTETPPISTQDRLLDAAEELFATKGFSEVSIRELAAAADVNVAAVNYHFQGKDNLLQEVILRRFVQQREATLNALEKVVTEAGDRPSLEQVIDTLVRTYLTGTLGTRKKVTFLSMIAEEMTGHHAQAHDVFFKEMIAPVFAAFSRALTAAHPRLTAEDLTWVIASIVGQIHHFIVRWKKARSFEEDSEALRTMLRVFPPVGLTVEQYIEAATDHISRFSSAAILALYPEDQQ